MFLACLSEDRGGELFVETENLVLSEDDVKSLKIKPGRYVKISVSDTGVSMDAGIRDRIFDPFFTTRKVGKGTGLGLASSYGIIRNHGGIIDVKSEKGKGSTFDIYLPAVESEVRDQRSVRVLNQGLRPSFLLLMRK
ncbi:MAG: hypothetical protein ISS63_16570 [Desulfobacteraceae bacterium]|nr:hypothetical protein [Desulfobacteraceae bacterium]